MAEGGIKFEVVDQLHDREILCVRYPTALSHVPMI